MTKKLNNLNKIKRSKEIITVLTKYGLNYFIDHSRLNFLIKIRKKSKGYHSLTFPERIRLALEDLGPTFIKFGQILSTRPDLLPADFIEEFSKLQDQIQPFDFAKVQDLVEQELGKEINCLFKDFDKNPIAAASLSQVHKATLFTGEIVAIKIQRPKIKETIALDLEILEKLASLLENRLRNGWVYHPKLMVSEFKRAINKELDFINEACNLEKFKNNFKKIDYIRFPKVYRDMSTKKILTMEFIDGVKINEIIQEKYKGVFDIKKVARRGVLVMFKQILEDGFFHADPHPANLFVVAPATIVMLDVGMVGYLDDKTIESGSKLFQGIFDKDVDMVVKGLEILGIVPEDFDEVSFSRSLNEFLEYYHGRLLKDLEISKISQDFIEIMLRYNLSLPAEMILMVKAISMVEASGKKLDQDLDVFLIAKPLVKNFFKRKFHPSKFFKKIQNILEEGSYFVEDFPKDLGGILKKIKKDELSFNFEHKGLEKLTREINSSSSRISISLVIAALFIASSLILQQPEKVAFVEYTTLGGVGYIVAGFFSLILIIYILKSKKEK